MRKFGLIGYPLGHSFSKGYFTNKFEKEGIVDAEYNNYPINPIGQFQSLINKNADLKGLNVTIPYKEKVIPFLNEIDEVAQHIGAVNTIRITGDKGNKILKGYNTDYYGFQEPLKPHLKTYHKKALILGTGGASKAVAYVLDKFSIKYKYVSRKPVNANIFSYEDITEEIMHEYLVIVNTSPLGMYPNVSDCPAIPYDSLTKKHILYDLVYNPEITLFLEKGKNKSATVINGLPMLHLQAEKAWEIWNT